MDQFDAYRAMGEFWARAGTALFDPGGLCRTAGQAPAPWPTLAAADLAALVEAQTALAQSWNSASALSQTLTAAMRGEAGASDTPAGAVLARLFDPQAWLGGAGEFDAALGRMAEGPQLADLRQSEQRFGTLYTAWIALQRARARHRAVMLDAWTKAAGTFAREANARADRGESFASAREMMQGWVETANAVLLEVQRSDAFLAAQRDILKASTDLKLAQQDMAALMSGFYGQPTRAEVDEVHKSLTELRREIRALHRASRAGRTRTGDDERREVGHG
ncbi:poly(R)-hydroxyalkanoic acid synthase subunit PhaE [Methylobacterium sp. Gmos1]